MSSFFFTYVKQTQCFRSFALSTYFIYIYHYFGSFIMQIHIAWDFSFRYFYLLRFLPIFLYVMVLTNYIIYIQHQKEPKQNFSSYFLFLFFNSYKTFTILWRSIFIEYLPTYNFESNSENIERKSIDISIITLYRYRQRGWTGLSTENIMVWGTW